MQIVSPLLIPSAGIIYNTTGTISKSNNLMHCNTVAFCIGKAANQYQNKVYQCPDSATAASKQHSHSCTGLAYIETMNTKATKEETEQQHYKPLLVLAFFGLLTAQPHFTQTTALSLISAPQF